MGDMRYWVSWSDCFDDESVELINQQELRAFGVDLHTHLESAEAGIESAAVVHNENFCFSVSCVLESVSDGTALDGAKAAVSRALEFAGAQANLDQDGDWYSVLLKSATVRRLAA